MVPSGGGLICVIVMKGSMNTVHWTVMFKEKTDSIFIESIGVENVLF